MYLYFVKKGHTPNRHVISHNRICANCIFKDIFRFSLSLFRGWSSIRHATVRKDANTRRYNNFFMSVVGRSCRRGRSEAANANVSAYLHVAHARARTGRRRSGCVSFARCPVSISTLGSVFVLQRSRAFVFRDGPLDSASERFPRVRIQ